MAESELFGYVKGAFTGAITNKRGYFEMANSGTLFLDEVGDLSQTVQAKLLRAIQEKEIITVGGDPKPVKVDVRLISATNKNLPAEIKDNRFREDLYYRLGVVEIKLPPLRERRSDIPKIALHVINKIKHKSNNPSSKEFTQDALSKLQNHSWKGNIRELRNVIERTVVTSRKDRIDACDLVYQEDGSESDIPLPEICDGFSKIKYLQDIDKKITEKALKMANGNKSKASRLLGISSTAVDKFCKKHNQTKF